MIREITIVGGTHGNESIGPALLKKFEQCHPFACSSIPVSTFLANPAAVTAGRRFIDEDLNRSFSDDILASPVSPVYEHDRAREINEQLGPKPNPERFLIDLHSTTANMGMTLIVKNDKPFNLKAAAYIQQHCPDVRIIMSDVDRRFGRTLNSLCDHGLTVEVGPIANAVVRHDLFAETEAVVARAVEYLNFLAGHEPGLLPSTVEVFRVRERVPYPRNATGNLEGMVHQGLQDRDFELLEPGQPVFHMLDGRDVVYEGQPGYPIFINEAAYYREDTAFVLTERLSLPLT
ncbi:MAG: aspartoacylase [Endozoicomonas sp.]